MSTAYPDTSDGPPEMTEYLTPAQVAQQRLIPDATNPRSVRDLCAARAITCRWNGRDGNGARYWLTREAIDAYNRRMTVRARTA